MDIVIPYRKSQSNGLELRYTLRGIQQYFPDLENIFIIGDSPGWLQNVIHIPAQDASQRHMKAYNIMRKLLVACKDKRVSDSFAMFNDDHFLLKPWESGFYYFESLEVSIAKFNSHQNYRQTLVNTMARLNGGKNFDTHCPIVYQKEIFLKTMKMVDWSRPWGYGIKSLYCNLSGIEGEFYQDLKFKSFFTYNAIYNMIGGRQFFSIDDRALNRDMQKVLSELYPQISQYESY
jgi:hypothetical protein